MNKVTRGATVFALFALGFTLPSLLNFKPRVEFVERPVEYSVAPCVMSSDRCESGDYRLEIHDGDFEVVKRTNFTLYYLDQAVTGEVLVTSNDNQFGTLNSLTLKGDRKEVLIPYCGNPIMEIIVIDKVRKQALQLPVL